MNQKQIQKINMIDSTLVVLNQSQNKSLWQANPTFSSAVNNIQANIGVLNTADTVRLATTIPFTETKGQAKVALIEATMLHAAAGIGYASSAANAALRASCEVTESGLIRTPDADLGSACMIIYNAVKPFIGNMGDWIVSALTLAALEADVNTFNLLVGTPVGQVSIKTAAGLTIDTQLLAIDGILDNLVDTLMVQFKTAQPSFYDAYFSARKIHNTGVHHSVIFSGFIYDSTGVAVPHAEVKLSINGKILRKHFTDESGKYRFTRLRIGIYLMQVSLPGFVTQSKTFNLTELQFVETDFTLHVVGPITGGGNPTT